MKPHKHSKTKAAPNSTNALHFYQGDRLTTEVTAQGHRSLMWAPDVAVAQRENEQDSHLLQTDTAGSILALQQIRDLQTMAYSPYGHLGAGNRESLLGFNGQKPDSVTGGYLLGNGNRLYSPVLKRFTSADTLSPFKEGGLNAYCYCEGDPINYHDPLGTFRLLLRARSAFPRVHRSLATISRGITKNVQHSITKQFRPKQTVASNSASTLASSTTSATPLKPQTFTNQIQTNKKTNLSNTGSTQNPNQNTTPSASTRNSQTEYRYNHPGSGIKKVDGLYVFQFLVFLVVAGGFFYWIGTKLAKGIRGE